MSVGKRAFLCVAFASRHACRRAALRHASGHSSRSAPVLRAATSGCVLCVSRFGMCRDVRFSPLHTRPEHNSEALRSA